MISLVALVASFGRFGLACWVSFRLSAGVSGLDVDAVAGEELRSLDSTDQKGD
jgi:hypothetical protein